MMDKLILFYYLFIICIQEYKSANIQYEIKSLSYCDNTENSNGIFKNLTLVSLNRTTKAIIFDFVLKEPFGDNLEAKIEMKKLTAHGWVVIPSLPYMRDPCSSMLKIYKKDWVFFAESVGVKHSDKCPIPPGNYKNAKYAFNGQHQSFSNTLIPMRGIVFFRVVIREWATRKVVGCIKGTSELSY